MISTSSWTNRSLTLYIMAWVGGISNPMGSNPPSPQQRNSWRGIYIFCLHRQHKGLSMKKSLTKEIPDIKNLCSTSNVFRFLISCAAECMANLSFIET